LLAARGCDYPLLNKEGSGEVNSPIGASVIPLNPPNSGGNPEKSFLTNKKAPTKKQGLNMFFLSSLLFFTETDNLGLFTPLRRTKIKFKPPGLGITFSDNYR
jgi:hypothetical protein